MWSAGCAMWRLRAARVGACVLTLVLATSAAQAQGTAPRILLDQPERIVEYQLNRLTREELMAVERRDSDTRYRPVYVALLTREGLPVAAREEAVAALSTIERAARSRVLLQALARIPEEGRATAAQLTRLLLQQAPAELLRDRPIFTETVSDGGAAAFAATAAYAGLLAGGEDVPALWDAASANADRFEWLLRGASALPAAASLAAPRADLARRIGDWLRSPTTGPSGVRAAALSSLSALQPDAGTATVLVRELAAAQDGDVRAAAVRALTPRLVALVADAAVPPAIDAIVAWVQALAPEGRTSADVTDALALAEALTGRLPAASQPATRRTIRGLGAKVVRLATLPEQVSFDTRWFVVEAGRPVEIVLSNPDAMPHNVVIGRPGSLEKIGVAASAMPMPTDAEAKPFVPDLPEVLFATRLAQQDETLRLAFTAPAAPGAYVFACTFPGHWLRMYGVMLVVESLDAWEAKPAVPLDPMTGQPFPATTSAPAPSR